MSYLGSSEWLDWKGYEKQEALKGDALVFGYPLQGKKADKHRLAAFVPNRHFLSAAPTRSGKGVSLIIPNLLQYAGSCIVIDPKGEIPF